MCNTFHASESHEISFLFPPKFRLYKGWEAQLHSHQNTFALARNTFLLAHILAIVSVYSLFRMPRRARRSGVRFIEDDRDRSLTFFKRRSGLFKAASDLSALTGTNVAVVLESETGKFSSFGTPKAGPIVDSFISGNATIDFDTSEEEKARITNLQNELFQVEKYKATEDKRKDENMAQAKEIQETSRFSKFFYGSIEDLDAAELFEMYRELSRIKQEINDRLPTLLPDNRLLQDPPLFQPTWWHSMPSYVAMPPNYYPWVLSQASFHQHP